MEEMFTQLLKAKESPPQPPHPKIQKVAHYFREREHFTKHYTPKLLSIGPIHHGKQNLQLGEHYKLIWAAMYIESTGQSPQALHKRIADNINELKDLFTKDLFTTDEFTQYTSQGFHDIDEKISRVLFVDACSLLHILENAKLHQVEMMKVKVDQVALVIQDVLLLENQLPYEVLKLLWRDEEAKLIQTMKSFLKCHHWSNQRKQKHQNPTNKLLKTMKKFLRCQHWTPSSLDNAEHHTNEEAQSRQESRLVFHDESPIFHLLDLQRKIILYDTHPEKAKKKIHHNQQGSQTDDMITYKNIQDLKASGIKLKSTETRRPRDISFSPGWFAAELKLPEIVVDDTTPATFLNLIAYEMCPDFENDYGICSFAAFLDSLIDHPDDVKALRSEGILLNSLGSDDEVANLFNTISSDLPDTGRYFDVRARIDKHYKNKGKTWIAQACYTYFSNPWSFIAFLAAVVALVLTFIQTWFAIKPAK